MKQLELTLVYRTTEGEILDFNKIESNDMIELLCKLNLLIVGLVIRIQKHEQKDDDIPF